jgi:hypothetical protein
MTPTTSSASTRTSSRLCRRSPVEEAWKACSRSKTGWQVALASGTGKRFVHERSLGGDALTRGGLLKGDATGDYAAQDFLPSTWPQPTRRKPAPTQMRPSRELVADRTGEEAARRPGSVTSDSSGCRIVIVRGDTSNDRSIYPFSRFLRFLRVSELAAELAAGEVNPGGNPGSARERQRQPSGFFLLPHRCRHMCRHPIRRGFSRVVAEVRVALRGGHLAVA